MYTFIYTLLIRFQVNVKNNFHKKLQFCKGGTNLKTVCERKISLKHSFAAYFWLHDQYLTSVQSGNKVLSSTIGITMVTLSIRKGEDRVEVYMEIIIFWVAVNRLFYNLFCE